MGMCLLLVCSFRLMIKLCYCIVVTAPPVFHQHSKGNTYSIVWMKNYQRQ